MAASQAGRRGFKSRLPLHFQQVSGTPKTCTLLHYIKRLHDAFRFGMRTTFPPSTEFSSFLAAAALCLMSVFA